MTIIDKSYQKIISIAINAGKLILDIRNRKKLDIMIKADASPVTAADYASHNYIMSKLQLYYPDIPIISEEHYSKDTDMQDMFFLIDPLDGTRDFIEGTDDYCVNIALMKNSRPFFSVIYIPERHQCYYALYNVGSFRILDCDKIIEQERITVNSGNKIQTQIISKRTNDKSYATFKGRMHILKTIYAGSAIKFCRIAEGEADIYPRVGQTGEWDTAAGDLIVTQAGGVVCDKNNQSLIYGKSDQNFLNSDFYAAHSILSL